MERSSRRQFLARGALLAAGAAGAGVAWEATREGPASAPPPPSPKPLRKLLDIGPGGVIAPGSAQDLRAAGNAGYFTDTDTRWIRMWADWPSLQPSADHAPDDPRSPAAWKLRALDEQIALANSLGLRVMLMPYRFPRWANGTEDLVQERRAARRSSTGCPPTPTGPAARGRGSSRSCTTATTRAASPARGSRASSWSTSPTCSSGRSPGSRARSRG